MVGLQSHNYQFFILVLTAFSSSVAVLSATFISVVFISSRQLLLSDMCRFEESLLFQWIDVILDSSIYCKT